MGDINEHLRNGEPNLNYPLRLSRNVRDINDFRNYARGAALYLIKEYEDEEIKAIHNLNSTAVDLGNFTLTFSP